MQPSKTIAVVDPVTTGAHLAPEIARRGWTSVAVLSSAGIPTGFVKGFRPDDFDEILTYDGDLDAVADRLAEIGVRFVIAGAETGVELADALAEYLELPGNGTALSRCRRDKFAMVERIRQLGLPSAASTVTADVAEMVAWAESGSHWPVVVKPVDSAGSDGVAFCSDATQLREAFARIHGEVNKLGCLNDQVMAQERLIGVQYFVNSVSRGGRHYVAEIWRDIRVGDNQIYDREELLDGDGELQRTVVSYVERVLDALGVVHGPAHTEVMLTEAGPILIESGARMQGSIAPVAHAAATGTSQVELTVDCHLEPAAFDLLPGTTYKLRKQLRIVSLIAPHDGVIADGPALAELNSLPTLSASVRRPAAGTPVRRTIDLFSSPDHLYLLDADPAAIERDYARIRELEQDGLYEAGSTVTPEPVAA